MLRRARALRACLSTSSTCRSPTRRRPLRLRAGFLADLFLRRFERRFHIMPLSFRAKSRNLSISSWQSQRCLDFARHDKNGSSSGELSLHKILFRRGRASSKFHMAKISLRFAPAFRVRRQFCFNPKCSAKRNGPPRNGAKPVPRIIP